MVRYIDLLVSISKNCKRCSKSRLKKDRDLYEDAVFMNLRGLVTVAREERHHLMISEDLEEEVIKLQQELSLACNDCTRSGAVWQVIDSHISSVQKYLDERTEQIEKKKKAKSAVSASTGKLIYFPGCSNVQ
jgi:hypothetical protein